MLTFKFDRAGHANLCNQVRNESSAHRAERSQESEAAEPQHLEWDESEFQPTAGTKQPLE